ncbi:MULTISPECIES: nuclear transport factor 2 family protein [Bradyrhizobium]|uniref:Nuclear transport factor 2 family protein n=3 Tax=Bradyrhizobium TaxID=374 RepID=A0AAE5X8T2_9BRAD|nr:MULTISPECIES: nuclear transport factor 2 family protein [Bradyrhizobium]MCG2628237.1 nuclear transport factor 2 family protein [Bradyrhizobium zhengyangense]MCG2643356.1 nuclear transport factor 2 family protein [Bradyrhizobium zhengyangense]MCG2670330.1 nuclear transport factor 2 family protein [Bradyrhizobium zhengyangense]MDN4985935.1 nuclear transport factor 2 family protein [Bradyrhizobium sp. WYCCWR 13022]MDN5002685.1 nuclear transport factor 2 family protein [Bradyrhizobium sp. WYCCW
MQRDRLERAADILEAQATVLSFMEHFDYGNAEAAAGLFTEDGVWHRGDGLVRGKGMLVDLINRRDRNLVVRHLISNIRSEWLNEDRILIHAYVTLLSQRSETTPQQFPLPFDGVAGFGRYEDELHRSDGRWLIARKKTVTELKKK